MHNRPDPAASWQESVWSYPRPPRIEPTPQVVAVDLGGRRIAETRRALRVLETSHPPVYYLPRADVAPGVLRPGRGRTWCEFKGQATYFDVVLQINESARCSTPPVIQSEDFTPPATSSVCFSTITRPVRGRRATSSSHAWRDGAPRLRGYRPFRDFKIEQQLS